MKKKFLSLALVLAMALTLLPTAAFATITHGTLDGGTTCTDTNTVWTLDNGKHKQACATCGAVDDGEGHDPAFTGTVTTSTTTDKHNVKCANCDLTEEQDCEAASSPVYVSGGTGNQHVTQCDACKEGFGTPVNCAPADDASPKYSPATGNNAGKTHTFVCKDCKQTRTESCDFGTSETTCTKCGAARPTTTEPETVTAVTLGPKDSIVTPGGDVEIVVKGGTSSPSGLVAASVFEITNGTLTWKQNDQDIAEQPASNKAPAAAGTYTVAATVTIVAGSQSDYKFASGSSIIATGSVTVDPGTPETPTTPTKPEPPKEDNKAPSNNSQGIPVASEVSTPTQANQAINTLKNTNASTLQERLMTNDTAASSFASLEDAVKRAKGISVSVDVATSSAPSAVRSGVGVTGAAFNASGSSVRLVVNAPSKSYSASTGYQISMTLTGVSNPAKLAVPVIITLPLPSDVRADRLVVLHYHDGSSTPTTIVPAVSGSSLRFTVTGFSDFVVTDQESAGNNGVSQAFTTVQGGNRNDGTLDDATLASIAAMLSGDGVFVDVPSTHWAAKEIRWARDGGLMSGYGNGSFGPTASTTRQQLWMVLARLSGTRPADMAMARQWAINTGVSDGSDPTGVLSRQQLVTMLYRFAKSQGKDVSASAKLSGYTDNAKVASYAKEALSWAAAKGIMSGSNGKLNPEGTATRAHFAVFLYRYSNG